MSRGFEKGNITILSSLDPGHGGKDPGASYYNITEKNLNMQVYQKLRKERRTWLYILFFLQKTVFVDLSPNVQGMSSDIFISIHFNASGCPASNRSGIQTAYSYEEAAGYPSKINPYWHNH